MPRRPGHILPFRIPFFRIFYSTTYTTIYIICLCLLVITPASMIWSAIQSEAYQYIIMIGGTYLLTALIAIFIYASRLYTNRTVLAGVGKAYIPVEDGEVGRGVRKMIAKQLERSAMIAWESRPRDLLGEILQAETHGVLPPESTSLGRNDYTVGRAISVDPSSPPWGDVQHAGWSSPSQDDDNETPNLQFATVIAELPNLIEAKAVSLAPPDHDQPLVNGQPVADPIVVDALCRPQTTGMRDYLTQLSYLGLLNPPHVGRSFLLQYEKARFAGSPITHYEFEHLMAAFADLLAGMTALDDAVIDEIHKPPHDAVSLLSADDDLIPAAQQRASSSSSPHTPISSLISPVTARSAPSRSITPYHHEEVESTESLGSVLRRKDNGPPGTDVNASSAVETESLSSDAASVIRRTPSNENG